MPSPTMTRDKFVLVHTDFEAEDWLPRIVEPRDLERHISGAIHSGEDPVAGIRLWWFAMDGHPIECRLVADKRPVKYDEHDYADGKWYVVTERGTVLAELAVRIDGRA